jgi:hypothetical protein
VRHKESEDSLYFWIGLLSLFYGAGEFLQLMHIGPLFLRWHLSDFGFPFMFALWAKWLLKLPSTYAMIAGGIFATAFELFQFSIGNGDPIDLAMFAASVIVGLIIIKQ